MRPAAVGHVILEILSSPLCKRKLRAKAIDLLCLCGAFHNQLLTIFQRMAFAFLLLFFFFSLPGAAASKSQAQALLDPLPGLTSQPQALRELRTAAGSPPAPTLEWQLPDLLQHEPPAKVDPFSPAEEKTALAAMPEAWLGQDVSS
mmetsp:Transcript_16142/g.30119  ORF Transcript_16142/g.30119 Transcript_16142/m.30119 type:complete len:146 (+) Transcript_16142:1153-1590(+)